MLRVVFVSRNRVRQCLAGEGTIFIKYNLDILEIIRQPARMKMMQANQIRVVDDPAGLLLKAILEQAVMDIVEPNQYVDKEAHTTAKKLISSCVLDELIESSGLELNAHVVRQRLKIARDKTSDYYYGVGVN